MTIKYLIKAKTNPATSTKPEPAKETPKPATRISRTKQKAEWTPDLPLPVPAQEVFIQAVFCQKSRMNIVKAYMLAYPQSTEASAYAAGSRLFRNVNIQERYQYLRDQITGINISDALERAEYLTEIHRAEITDFQENLPDIGDVITIHKDSPFRKAVAELHDDVTYEQRKDGETEVTVHHKKLKLHNGIDAVKELNKMQGSYPLEERNASSLENLVANGIVVFKTNLKEERG